TVVSGDAKKNQSNQWSFTIDTNMALVSASDAVGGFPDASFVVQAAKGPNDASGSCPAVNPFGNTTARAERHLAGEIIDPTTMAPFPNEAVGTPNGFSVVNVETNAVNYEQCGHPAGYFGGNVR